MKTCRIHLQHYRQPTVPPDREHLYSVVRVTNSVEYFPGQLLSKKEVDTICRLRDWEVTIEASK